MLYFSFCPVLFVRFCERRHSRGGRGRRSATEVCRWVLVVPPHVEPHAASPLPQWVLTAGADGPQQRVCAGEMDGQARTHISFTVSVSVVFVLWVLDHTNFPRLHFFQGHLCWRVGLKMKPLQNCSSLRGHMRLDSKASQCRKIIPVINCSTLEHM